MAGINALKNCRILIKEAGADCLLADTKIKACDERRSVLFISASSLAERKERMVVATVFCGGRIYEFYGRLKKTVVSNEVELELAKGKIRAGRQHERYVLTEPGSVEALELEGELFFLRKPIPVQTKDISENGILLKGIRGSFRKGSVILLSLDMGGSMLHSKYKVVRLQNTNMETEEYGCAMLTP